MAHHKTLTLGTYRNNKRLSSGRFVPRCVELQELHGQVVAQIRGNHGVRPREVSALCDLCEALQWSYNGVCTNQCTPRGESIYKWLKKNGWAEERVQRLQTWLTGQTLTPVTLSVRHKDILRCSITPHYSSCYRPNGICEDIPFDLCTRNNVAICVARDRRGNFTHRVFVQYNTLPKNFTFGRVYPRGTVVSDLPQSPETMTPFDK